MRKTFRTTRIQTKIRKYSSSAERASQLTGPATAHRKPLGTTVTSRELIGQVVEVGLPTRIHLTSFQATKKVKASRRIFHIVLSPTFRSMPTPTRDTKSISTVCTNPHWGMDGAERAPRVRLWRERSPTPSRTLLLTVVCPRILMESSGLGASKTCSIPTTATHLFSLTSPPETTEPFPVVQHRAQL